MIALRYPQKRYRNILKTVITKPNGWFPTEDFSIFLKKEKDRSRRSGLPTSCVFVDLSNHYKNPSLISKHKYYDFLGQFLELFTANSRFIDTKCITDNHAISILLVDTSIEQAAGFIDKLSKKLLQHFQLQRRLEYISLMKSIVVSAFCLNQPQNGRFKKESPKFIKRFLLADVVNRVSIQPQLSNGDAFESNVVEELNPSYYYNWDLFSLVEDASDYTSQIEHKIEHEPSRLAYRFFKRVIDFAGAVFGIAAFMPLMVVVGLAVKLTSKGPMLFKQQRIGHHGKLFTFLKFRSMRVDNDDKIHQEYMQKLINGQGEGINNGRSDENPVYKIQDDPRITNVGKFIRKTSLDELPQFFNVLMGTMSLVGPRPPIPYEVELYQTWHLRRITEAKPGITGLWQVYGRNRTKFDDMVRLDLQYVKSRSTVLDIKLMFMTVWVMIKKKSGI